MNAEKYGFNGSRILSRQIYRANCLIPVVRAIISADFNMDIFGWLLMP